MKLKTIEGDSLIWSRAKPINQEVMSLIAELLKSKKNTTYEVELDKPMHSLRASVNRHIKAAVKAKDKTGKFWYVKVLTRTRRKAVAAK